MNENKQIINTNQQLVDFISKRLKKIPRYYSKVQCSHDNPMIQLREVEKMLTELDSKIINKEIKEQFENLISSKSSDYNKGVQDCINILMTYL